MVLMPLGERLDRERPGASRHQFDRQGQPVQPMTEREDGLQVARAGNEIGVERRCPVEEERSGVVQLDLVRRHRLPGLGEPERRHDVHHLALDAQALAACRQDP
jgi:hypothetical protein